MGVIGVALLHQGTPPDGGSWNYLPTPTYNFTRDSTSFTLGEGYIPVDETDPGRSLTALESWVILRGLYPSP